MNREELKKELEKLSEKEISDFLDYNNNILALHNDFDCWFVLDDVKKVELEQELLSEIAFERSYYDKWYSR